jgi:hypothetical protein
VAKWLRSRLRGLLLRAGSGVYLKCFAPAPNPYFFIFFRAIIWGIGLWQGFGFCVSGNCFKLAETRWLFCCPFVAMGGRFGRARAGFANFEITNS